MYNQSKHCHSDIILLTLAYRYSIKLQWKQIFLKLMQHWIY